MSRSSRFSLIFVFVLLFLLTGCYNTPVRHLASDVSLLKSGVSTTNDVLTYLGKPDEQYVRDDGADVWVYKEAIRSDLERAPLFGHHLKESGDDRVVVILLNNIVDSCTFYEHGKNELDWREDFSWQKKK